MTKIIDLLKSIPTLLVPFLCLVLFFTWAGKNRFENAIENLTLKEMTILVKTETGEPILDASIGIEPKYSFDEIKPKWRMTSLGAGQTRIAVVFERHFKVAITATGYYGENIECSDDSSTAIIAVLKKI